MYFRGPIGSGLIEEDPYKVLEIPEDCSEKDIKKAYKKLALQCHPDK